MPAPDPPRSSSWASSRSPASGREGAVRLHARGARLWRTRVLARRRAWAALLTAVAVIAALRATAPPPPPSAQVWVAAHDLPAGAVLGAADLARAPWPSGAVPDGTLAEPHGRTVTTGLRRGEPVTDARVVGAPMMAAHPGRVALPVRVPDPTTVSLLRVGDRVDLLATDPAEGRTRTVARDAVVAALPRDPAGGAQAPGGRVVVVALTPDEVAGTGVAAVRDFLTVAWPSRPPVTGTGAAGAAGRPTTTGAASR